MRHIVMSNSDRGFVPMRLEQAFRVNAIEEEGLVCCDEEAWCDAPSDDEGEA